MKTPPPLHFATRCARAEARRTGGDKNKLVQAPIVQSAIFGLGGTARFFDRLNLVVHAVSLGGPETLVTRPAKSSHRGMTAEARHLEVISNSLIRLSAGIEDAAEQAIVSEV